MMYSIACLSVLKIDCSVFHKSVLATVVLFWRMSLVIAVTVSLGLFLHLPHPALPHASCGLRRMVDRVPSFLSRTSLGTWPIRYWCSSQRRPVDRSITCHKMSLVIAVPQVSTSTIWTCVCVWWCYNICVPLCVCVGGGEVWWYVCITWGHTSECVRVCICILLSLNPGPCWFMLGLGYYQSLKAFWSCSTRNARV